MKNTRGKEKIYRGNWEMCVITAAKERGLIDGGIKGLGPAADGASLAWSLKSGDRSRKRKEEGLFVWRLRRAMESTEYRAQSAEPWYAALQQWAAEFYESPSASRYKTAWSSSRPVVSCDMPDLRMHINQKQKNDISQGSPPKGRAGQGPERGAPAYMVVLSWI